MSMEYLAIAMILVDWITNGFPNLSTTFSGILHVQINTLGT